MKHEAAIVLALIAGLAGDGVPAQEIFEVPVELELSAAPLVIDLDAASLDIVLDADTAGILRAFGAPAAGAPGAAVSAIAVSSDGGTVVVRRAPAAESAGSAGDPRLRLELVLDPALRLDVFGSDLNIVVSGPAAEPEVAEADDDEDVPADEDDGNDDDDDDDDEDAGEEGAPVTAVPIIDPEDPHRLFFNVAASSLDFVGVGGASVNAVESFLHADDTRGQLTLSLEGATVEIAGHHGTLNLTSLDSEITLSDPVGLTAPVVTGGSLIVSGGLGQFQGRLVDALVRVEGWRDGTMVVAGSGSSVDARGLVGVRLELKGDGLDVALEDLEGYLLADLAGGSLIASRISGKCDLKARDGVTLSITGLEGQPTLTLADSSARLVDVSGSLKVDVQGGRLEVDGVQRLELAAVGAEVVARRIMFLTKAELTDVRLDLDLWELASNPSLNLRGATEARVRLRTPCSVKLGEADLLGGGADVTGCELHSQSLRRTRQEARGIDGNRRVTLTATMEEDVTLDVEGSP